LLRFILSAHGYLLKKSNGDFSMRNLSLLAPVSAVLLANACTLENGKIDSNLKCAALISAASYLSAKGNIELNTSFDQKAPFSLMMHLNSYAIPNGIGEAEAFRQLEVQREALIQAKSQEKIRDGAEACIRKTPQQ
jgi:hypothetical protein